MQSHTEMRLVDVYHLVLARGDGKLGPRLRSASGVCDKWNAQMAAGRTRRRLQPPQPKQSAGAPPCGMTAGIRPAPTCEHSRSGEQSYLAWPRCCAALSERA